MSGIGMVLNIATTALNAQQYGLGVTAQNIANVNTEGYSRQNPVLVAKQPLMYGGLLLGRGVDTEQVSRSSDQLIENKLMQEKSNMSSSSEMEKYMQVLEGFFNESSGNSISTMVSDFWNGWYDISNHPSGPSERISLYEQSVLLSEQFNALRTDLTQIHTDLTGAVTSGIETINKITHEIAQVNGQIVSMETNNVANDLRDKRNALVSELNEYLDVKAFEQSDGSLTILATRGCTLVQGNSSYDLEMGGTNGDRIRWQNSSGSYVDITNYLTNGKLGGWLDMRDEIIAKNQLDLDALAKEFIWSVNQQHSQGVGLEGFSSVTGSCVVSDRAEELGTIDSGLDYYDKISDGTFNLWVYDSNGAVVGGLPISIPIDADSGGTTLTSLSIDIDAAANITASITLDGKLKIDADSGYTFAFSDDTSNVLAALGINTFFTGSSSGDMRVSDSIVLNKNFIAAAQVDSDGTMASGDNNNALTITNLQSTSMSISQWICDRINGNTQGSVISTIEDYYHSMVGAIGIVSASVSRDRSFGEMMVNELSTIRDGISAVSLDEEMTNIIKYQHAYAAAAKLISVGDEMLSTLLELK
ncbi:MAG TPA: flagellar hook-associated protein FlgK [Desulfobacteraceae bacterium]|nr:flagellar hook-associated protein FlgK [Desulfobacteraceae bacterium]